MRPARRPSRQPPSNGEYCAGCRSVTSRIYLTDDRVSVPYPQLQSWNVVLSPKLNSGLFAGHGGPDNDHQQLRYQEHGDEGDDSDKPGEQSAMPAEIPPIKGKADSQGRQWQQDDRVGQDRPRREEERGDLHHERKG